MERPIAYDKLAREDRFGDHPCDVEGRNRAPQAEQVAEQITTEVARGDASDVDAIAVLPG